MTDKRTEPPSRRPWQDARASPDGQTRGGGGLRRLDDRFLPRIAAGLHRAIAGVRRSGSRHRGLFGLTRAAVDEEPAVAGAITAVLVAAILLAALGEGNPSGGAALPRPVPPPPVAPLAATVGPAPGTSVLTYLARAAYDLRHFGEIANGRETYAVVDLRHYQTPAQTAVTFDGVSVVRAYAKVPSRLPTLVRSVPVNGVAGLASGLEEQGAVAATTAHSYRSLLQSFHPRTKAERQTRRRYVQARRAALVEAARLDRPARCRCVFAAVVRTGVARLAALSRLSAVRVVDPASPAIPLIGLTVRPLLPEVRTTVPTNGLLGG